MASDPRAARVPRSEPGWSAVPIVAIIPARLGSTRFPGKVLAARTGRPLIRHVYDAASRARVLTRVAVATDDERVAAAVRGFGGEAVMTSAAHASGTSRLAEAARSLGLPAESIVVNVQGDEPELDASVIDAAVGALRAASPDVPMSTAAVRFAEGEDARDPNIVKVVLRADGAAMYFSRSLIPFVRDAGAVDPVRPLRHVGLYVYRRPFLDVYAGLPPTALERTEQLEQLRVLAHGHAIAVAVWEGRAHAGIDTPEQYEAFVKRWRESGAR